MSKTKFKELYDNGILKAWLDGKVLQYKSECERKKVWVDISGSRDINDLLGLTLRVKPNLITKTLEWFSYADCKPEQSNKEIIFSRNGYSILATLSKNLRYHRYDGAEYFPIDTDYWAYINHPDDIPF